MVYLPDGVGAHRDNLEKLGPHTPGVGCLYLKDLSKVDISVLESIIRDSYATLTAGTFGHRARESSDRRPGGERSTEGWRRQLRRTSPWRRPGNGGPTYPTVIM